MDISQEARASLEHAGYRTASLVPTGQAFSFEDANLLGGGFVYENVDELLQGWESRQDRFLAEYAGRLRAVPDKLWNIYTVHLTAEACLSSKATALFNVEENFRGTRKLARAGIISKEQVQSALLALLPIQSLVEVGNQDANQIARERLSAIHPAFRSLFDDVTPAELAARLWERA